MKSRILGSLKHIIDEITDQGNLGGHPQLLHRPGSSPKIRPLAQSPKRSLAKKNGPNIQVIDFEDNMKEGKALDNRYLNFKRDNSSELMLYSQNANRNKRISDRKTNTKTERVNQQIADDFFRFTKNGSTFQQTYQKDGPRAKNQMANNPFLKYTTNITNLENGNNLDKHDHEKFIATLYEDLVASGDCSDLQNATTLIRNASRSKERDRITKNSASAPKAKSPSYHLRSQKSNIWSKNVGSDLKYSSNSAARNFRKSQDQNIAKRSHSGKREDLVSGQMSAGSRSRSQKQPKSTEIDIRRQLENCRMMSTNSENIYKDLLPERGKQHRRRIQASSLFASAEKWIYRNRNDSRQRGVDDKKPKPAGSFMEKAIEDPRETNTDRQPETLFSNFEEKIHKTLGSFRQMLKDKIEPPLFNQPKSHLNSRHRQPKGKSKGLGSQNLKPDGVSLRKNSLGSVCLTSIRSFCNSYNASTRIKVQDDLFEAYYLPVETVRDMQNESATQLKSCKSTVTRRLNKSGVKLQEGLMYNNSKKTFDKDGSSRFTPKTILPSQLSSQLLNENQRKRSEHEVKIADLKRSISVDVRSRESSIQKIFAKLKEANHQFKPKNTQLKEKNSKHSESDRKTKAANTFKFPSLAQSKFPTAMTAFSFLAKPLKSAFNIRKSKIKSNHLFEVPAVPQLSKATHSLTNDKNPHLEYLVDPKDLGQIDFPYSATEDFLANPLHGNIKSERADSTTANLLLVTNEVVKAKTNSNSFRLNTEKAPPEYAITLGSVKARMPSTKLRSARPETTIGKTSESKTIMGSDRLKGANPDRVQGFSKANARKGLKECFIGRKNDKFLSAISNSMMLKSRRLHLDSTATDKDGFTSSSNLNHVNSFKFSNVQ